MDNNLKTVMKPTVLSVIIASALITPVRSAENVQNMEEVLVWGTKVSSSSESLAAEDLSLKQADHLSDILRDVPGVDVGGTHSLNQRINIRGMNETNLDIRLDGASQHANMFHHIGNLTLNPDIIKSADIQVGANSVASGGIGGAVYFETKDAQDLLVDGEDFGARIFAGYGSNDNKQGSLTAYGQLTEQLDAMIYLYGISRGNFEDGDGDKTIGSDGDVKNILTKLGWQLTDEQRLQLSYDVYRDEGDYNPRPDMSGAANETFSNETLLPTEYDRETITLAYELDKGESIVLNASVYQNHIKLQRDESGIAPWSPTRQSDNSAENTNTGATVKALSTATTGEFTHKFTYGLDYNQQESESQYGSSSSMSEKATSTALFVEDRFYFTDAISMTAGLRFEDYQRDAITSSKDFNDITWALGADWDITNDFTLFLSTRSLFKAPELLESFIQYQDVAYLSNDIKAQTGQNTQAGFRFNKQIDQHQLGTTLTLFKTELDDYLEAEYQSGSRTYLIDNHGDAEIKGFEFSLTYGYDMFNSKLSYSKSDNKNTTNNTPIIGSNGRSTDMGDSIALTLDYLSLDLNTVFGLTSIAVLDETNVADGKLKKAGYQVHNIYAQWIPEKAEGLAITFGIDNLFDETYVSHASRSGSARGTITDDYEPGRNYKISASYQF